MEVDFKDKDRQQSQGIYLFTGGIPDQDMVGVLHPGRPVLHDPPSSPRQAPATLQHGFPNSRITWMLFKCRSWLRRPGLGPGDLHC